VPLQFLFGVYDKNLFSACDLQWLPEISGEEKALAKARAPQVTTKEKSCHGAQVISGGQLGEPITFHLLIFFSDNKAPRAQGTALVGGGHSHPFFFTPGSAKVYSRLFDKLFIFPWFDSE
jgi:hypothetical protein